MTVILAIVLAAGWSVSWSQVGGVMGRNLSLTVDDAGHAVARGRGAGSSRTLDAGELRELTDLVQRIQSSAPPRPEPPDHRRIRDAIYTSVVVTRDGRDYRVDPASAEGQPLFGFLGVLFDERMCTDQCIDTGRVWRVREGPARDGGIDAEWEGIWTRRERSNSYDCVWRNLKTGAEQRDEVLLMMARPAEVRFYRRGQGFEKHYLGSRATPPFTWPEKVGGVATFYGPGPEMRWEATVER